MATIRRDFNAHVSKQENQLKLHLNVNFLQLQPIFDLFQFQTSGLLCNHKNRVCNEERVFL